MTEPSPRFALPRRSVLLGGGAAVLTLAGAGALLARRDRFSGGEIDPPALLDAIRADEVVLIDIRRPDEWAETGIAEGAVPIDMRRDDFVQAVRAARHGDRPVALICARGVRSDRMSARLAEAGIAPLLDVPEGMLGSRAGPGWIARGLPVVQP